MFYVRVFFLFNFVILVMCVDVYGVSHVAIKDVRGDMRLMRRDIVCQI